MSKYGNNKIAHNGLIFDSVLEYKRYCDLKILEGQGKIIGLKRQVKFILIPAQREADEVGKRSGKKQGKVIERECAYYADFVYIDSDGFTVVEDTKGIRTPEYIIKRKLMLFVHGIRIREVRDKSKSYHPRRYK